MVLGGFVIEACQDSGQESPEGDGLVVGDVKSLQREPETRNCFPAAWGAGHAWSSAAACWLSQDQYFVNNLIAVKKKDKIQSVDICDFFSSSTPQILGKIF